MVRAMKTPDKYRFTLQWGAGTEEKIQAGEFLESLGNRKSEFVVLAISEYLRVHPETLPPGRKLKLVVQQSLTRKQIEAIITDIVEKKTAKAPSVQREIGEIDEKPAEIQSDVEEMLRNLKLFS